MCASINLGRLSVVVVFLTVLILPNVYGESVTVETGTVYENSVMVVTVMVQPNLNLTVLDVRLDEMQFDNRWFNLTHTGGLVDVNITSWSPDAGENRTVFIVNNVTLTDLKVWMNGSSPVTVYLDDVNSSASWTYDAGVTKVNASSAQNVTLSWQPLVSEEDELEPPVYFARSILTQDDDDEESEADVLIYRRNSNDTPYVVEVYLLVSLVSVISAGVVIQSRRFNKRKKGL